MAETVQAQGIVPGHHRYGDGRIDLHLRRVVVQSGLFQGAVEGETGLRRVPLRLHVNPGDRELCRACSGGWAGWGGSGA